MNIKQLKTQVIYSLLISLAALAGMGIWVLIFGNYGELEGKILATTILTGLFSLLCLAFLTQAGKKYQWLALAGTVASTASLVCGIILVWFSDGFANAEVWRWFFIFGTLGVSMAHQSLLLLLAERSKGNFMLLLTLGIIALVAVMLIYAFASEYGQLPENYWRIVGALVILDVLGTVATPILARLNR